MPYAPDSRPNALAAARWVSDLGDLPREPRLNSSSCGVAVPLYN